MNESGQFAVSPEAVAAEEKARLESVDAAYQFEYGSELEKRRKKP